MQKQINTHDAAARLASAVTDAADLDALLDALSELDASGVDSEASGLVDLTNLPTFGGTEPENTTGVWSWDEDSLIVGTCLDDLRIVTREDFAEFGLRA